MKSTTYACRIESIGWLGTNNWYYFINFKPEGGYTMTVIGPSSMTWRDQWRFFWTPKMSEPMWRALMAWQHHYCQAFPNALDYLRRLGFK